MVFNFEQTLFLESQRLLIKNLQEDVEAFYHYRKDVEVTRFQNFEPCDM
jgi:hypothetical protein